MAGSEMSGVESAVPYLFLNATYVITPTANTHVTALNKMVRFAEALGANVTLMDPEMHDRCASIISHIPHILSACILRLAAEEQSRTGETFGMAAGSFKDMTRVASSSPEMWRDILLSNKEAITDTLAQFESLLARTRQILSTGDIEAVEELFADAKLIKERYLKNQDD
jgi:prephenate dehydrogenase